MGTLAQGVSATIALPADQALVFQDGAAGIAVIGPGIRNAQPVAIDGATTIGPFSQATTVSLSCTRGTLLYSTVIQSQQLPWRVVNDTAYTLQAGDRRLAFVNGSAIAVTFPPGLPGSFECAILQEGAGQITFAAGGGATLTNVSAQLKTAGQGAVVAVLSGSALNAGILTGSTSA